MKYYKNFNLTNYNSFGLNSIAKEIWFPENIIDLRNILKKLKSKSFNILSHGTNVLLAPNIDKIICLKKIPSGMITTISGLSITEASTSITYFAKDIISNNFSGTEGLLGIPGSVGAAIMGNAGSGNHCISNFLNYVLTLDYQGNTNYYTKENLNFKRRYSLLQDKKEIIIQAIFEFTEKNPKQDIVNKTLEFRKNFPKGYSAGGLFKNWYILKPYEKEIRDLKSSNLYVSSLLNVIINKGNASYDDIIEFINQIRIIVKEPLKLEIKIIGKSK